MKLVLQRQFDPPIEHPVPKINKIAMTSEKHSFGTKWNVGSSSSDSIIGDVLPTHSYGKKTVATHSQRCHGSEQKLKPSMCGIVQNKSLNARKFSCPRKKSHIVYTEKYFHCKEDKNTYYTSIVPHSNSSHSTEISCRHVEQVVQISCDASTKPVVLTVDDASNGVSVLPQEVQRDDIVSCTKGQRSSIFTSLLLMVVVLQMLLVQIWLLYYLYLRGGFQRRIICNGRIKLVYSKLLTRRGLNFPLVIILIWWTAMLHH
jgi:hypothetical protein